MRDSQKTEERQYHRDAEPGEVASKELAGPLPTGNAQHIAEHDPRVIQDGGREECSRQPIVEYALPGEPAFLHGAQQAEDCQHKVGFRHGIGSEMRFAKREDATKGEVPRLAGAFALNEKRVLQNGQRAGTYEMGIVGEVPKDINAS